MNTKIAGLLMVAVAGLAIPAEPQSKLPTARVANASATAPAVQAVPAEKPVARVNGTVLTDRDLLCEMYAIFPYARQHNGGFPKAMEADIRKGALQMIVFEELVYQETQRRGMGVTPE